MLLRIHIKIEDIEEFLICKKTAFDKGANKKKAVLITDFQSYVF